MAECPFGYGSADTRERAQRDSEWSPSLDETFGSAHAEYADLRHENPFPWSEDFGGFWAATTYADIVRIAQDDDGFITSVQNVVPHVPRSSRRPPLHFDPPEHTAYRQAIDPVLRRSVVRAQESAFRASAERLVDEMLGAAAPDGVSGLAAPFAMECFAAFLGVAPDLTRHVREVGVRYSFAIQDMDDAVIAECSTELYEIAEKVYRDRLAEDPDPARDLIASLHVAAGDPSNDITEKTAIATVRQMIVAGMGAPQAVIGSCVAHLAQDADLQQRLRRTPEDIPAAAEELLRLHAPYRVFARTARRDVEVHGRLVREGEPVALLFPSANRDDDAFEDPDRFVLHRPQNSHLAFGRGAHRCPAATMGRMEVVIALETLLSKTSSFALSGEIQMMNWLEYGPRSVPLSLAPAR
ncbi:cytochrome P450 [Microbacterium sp. G2-8]|uniref:cytochrome P450 n=1 Tax=Microbacterium sp. G2-8 TaxID=2842454 RepID=UPI001C89EA56|nr:cytochrome P450 [Microbacterium sp. G2-8]